MCADDKRFWVTTASIAASKACGRSPSSLLPGTGVNGTATWSLG
jgi:hypothetical protein